MNEASGQQRATEGAKVQIAAMLAEELDGASKRTTRWEPQELGEPSRHADVPRREDIEASCATQEDQGRAPRTDAWELREEADRVTAIHAR